MTLHAPSPSLLQTLQIPDARTDDFRFDGRHICRYRSEGFPEYDILGRFIYPAGRRRTPEYVISGQRIYRLGETSCHAFDICGNYIRKAGSKRQALYEIR